MYYYNHSLLFTGNKSDLIKILKQKDREFLTKYLKDILPLQQWLVKNKMSQSILTSEDDGLSEVSTIKLSKGEDGDDISIVVNKQCFRQLGFNQPLGENVNDAVACLFQLRDDRICESHKSVNSNKHNYQPFQRSKYVRAFFGKLSYKV